MPRARGGRRPAFALAASALLALSGCATLSEGECKTANWYQLGRSDGADGYTRARLYEHSEACAEYGIRPDAEAYYAGRRAGLAHYCTPRSGFREGREGREYRGVCTAKTEAAFLAEYRKGKAIHEVVEEIEDAENAIDSLERRLADEDTPNDQRDRIRAELRGRLRELRHLTLKLARLERRYDPGNLLLY